jgi:hypothetical protein
VDPQKKVVVLHLVNGEATKAKLGRARVSGTIESVDDILMEGPLQPQQHEAALEQRATFLEKYLHIPRAEYLSRSRQRRGLLAGANDADEAVFWFEEDVFCQVNYLDAFSWLADRANGSQMSFVCPPAQRLGESSAQQLERWFAQRKPVNRDLLAFATEAWVPLTQDSPKPLADFIDRADFRPWPSLRDALQAQLARLPSTRNGLGRIEEVILRAVAAGASSFDDVFTQINQHARIYGVGDLQVLRYLIDLAHDNAPLLHIVTSNGRPRLSATTSREWKLSLSPLGRAVLDGTQDYLEVVPTERWVGGVIVNRDCRWRWENGLVYR